ncbi:uncharacterized protein LOC129302675 [Prosopis cineraria]|uniref:uncharacterized protein LOC129302675 n=1 Tax=Prosopis cineraria TaxID=364024 RepID=UPI0024104934|nr:uncharacterized protein LOC129302675 [Prosopis cineraria]
MAASTVNQSSEIVLTVKNQQRPEDPPTGRTVDDKEAVVAAEAKPKKKNKSRMKEMEEFFRYNSERDKPSDVRTALLTVAVLIATATYQSGLSPPGGVWQETKPEATPSDKSEATAPGGVWQATPPGGVWQATPPVATPPGGEENKEVAGVSIMGTKSIPSFAVFMVGNSVGFFMSLYTIEFLTRGFPLRIELTVCLLALTVTYCTSMHAVMPPSVSLIVTIFYGLSIGLPISLPFIVRHLRDSKCVRKFRPDIKRKPERVTEGSLH